MTMRTVCAILVLLAAKMHGQKARPLPELDRNLRTGPDVGASIPAFSAEDQRGVHRDFASLRGPKGLVLLFVRSADW